MEGRMALKQSLSFSASCWSLLVLIGSFIALNECLFFLYYLTSLSVNAEPRECVIRNNQL